MPIDIDLYRRVDINSKVASADPYELIRLLYERGVNNLNQAESLHEGIASDAAMSQRFDRVLCNTIDVVSALQEALDLNVEAELPHQLDRLYDYIQRRLLHARIQKDLAAVVESLSLLETLQSGWQQIAPDSTR